MTATALHPPCDRSAPQRKAVLFCPECGYADRIDGEWITDASGERERYDCPDCGTTVVAQPRL